MLTGQVTVIHTIQILSTPLNFNEIMIRSTFLLFLLLSIPVTLLADVKFREDFRENEAHIPIANDDLTSPFLSYNASEKALTNSSFPTIPKSKMILITFGMDSPKALS